MEKNFNFNYRSDKYAGEIFILLLCGIPGVGKTFLSKILQERLTTVEGNFVHVLNFDKLLISKKNQVDDLEKVGNFITILDNISNNGKHKFGIEFLLNNFKKTRKEFFDLFKNKVEEIKYGIKSSENISQFLGGKHFIILDDIMI